MITYTGQDTYEYRGLSTDKKPCDDKVGNGSLFIEMDTGKVFLYNKKTKQWIEFSVGGGGGGGDVDEKLIAKAELLFAEASGILTLNLRNKDNAIVASANVDLPTEYVISSGYFDLDTNEIVLILADEASTEIRIPVGSLVSDIQAKIDAKQDRPQELGIAICTLDGVAWANLKESHSHIVSSAIAGLDASKEFVRGKLTINNIDNYVLLVKNTNNRYSGTFFIEESESIYELTLYYNGAKIVIRCAQVI